VSAHDGAAPGAVAAPGHGKYIGQGSADDAATATAAQLLPRELPPAFLARRASAQVDAAVTALLKQGGA
jgi:hypothetical protein